MTILFICYCAHRKQRTSHSCLLRGLALWHRTILCPWECGELPITGSVRGTTTFQPKPCQDSMTFWTRRELSGPRQQPMPWTMLQFHSTDLFPVPVPLVLLIYQYTCNPTYSISLGTDQAPYSQVRAVKSSTLQLPGCSSSTYTS